MDDQRADRDGGRMKRFSIRELLLVFVIVALVLGWFFDKYKGRARFEMHVTNNHAFVIDTVTGKVWGATISENGSIANDSELYPEKLPK